jgi:lipopolysaccharide/colanic/teichoic acid biosynthesis glycosyltransferase
VDRRLATLRVKHALDRVAAVAGLVATAPVFAAVALAIKLEDRGPVFYGQLRAGRDGVPFRVLKFRTMIVDAERQGLGLNVALGDSRITRVGRLLRDYSIDELPQLVNVLRGEMSVVGPRPGLVDQAERYDAFQRRRLEVWPGLTGWAQVNGRNALTWEERIALDVWYVDHVSLGLDLRILLRTPLVILRKEGLFGAGGVNVDLGGAAGAKHAPPQPPDAA